MTEAHPRNTRIMLATLVVGWAFVGFGIYAMLHRHIDPMTFAIWFIGGLLIHDLVIAPLEFGTGWALRRGVPGKLLAPVQAGLIASAIIFAFMIPSLFGPGKTPLNPSQLPNDYPRSLAIVLIAVWVGALGYGLARRRRA